MWYCINCGFGTSEQERFEEHMIVKHTDAVIDRLTTKALQEAAEIYELNRMFKLRVM